MERVRITKPAPGRGKCLTSVECNSASDCWAVGNSYNGVASNAHRAVERHFLGKHHRSERRSGQLPLARHVRISASDCWAVGRSNNAGAPLTTRRFRRVGDDGREMMSHRFRRVTRSMYDDAPCLAGALPLCEYTVEVTQRAAAQERGLVAEGVAVGEPFERVSAVGRQQVGRMAHRGPHRFAGHGDRRRAGHASSSAT